MTSLLFNILTHLLHWFQAHRHPHSRPSLFIIFSPMLVFLFIGAITYFVRGIRAWRSRARFPVEDLAKIPQKAASNAPDSPAHAKRCAEFAQPRTYLETYRSAEPDAGQLREDLAKLREDMQRLGERVTAADALVRRVPQPVSLNEAQFELSNAMDEIRENIRLFQESVEQRLTMLEVELDLSERAEGIAQPQKPKRKAKKRAQ